MKRIIRETNLPDGRILQSEVFYTKGGHNFMTSKVEERGYYLSVRPIERRKLEGGHVVETFTAFSGVKKFIQSAGRFSQKVLDSLTVVTPDLETMENHVKASLVTT